MSSTDAETSRTQIKLLESRDLFREKGFPLGGQIGEGSWGVVFAVEGVVLDEERPAGVLPGAAVKLAKPHSSFLEDLGCLQAEVACGLQQGEPYPARAVVGVKVEGANRIAFYPEVSDGLRAGVLMDRFDREAFLDRVLENGGIPDAAVPEFMHDYMRRLAAMFVPVLEGSGTEYARPERVAQMVVDSRFWDYGATDYPYRSQAGEVFRKIGFEIGALSEVIATRLLVGRFGEQHGDPRRQNVATLQFEGGRYKPVILDAVRVKLRGDGVNQQPRLMKEWHMTDTILQAGMVLGPLWAVGKTEMFAWGLKSYQEIFGEQVVGDLQLERLMAVALAYGISIDVHVLNPSYKGARGALLAHKEMNEVFGVSTDATAKEELRDKVAEMDQELGLYWAAMKKLATEPQCWKEATYG